MNTRAIDVLVVDDDYRVADIHAALVERVPGYQVVGRAHDSAEALTLSRSLQPDLVLMDVYLPDGNGLDVVRLLLADADPPDVIVISAARETAAVRTAMQLGAVHYLVKPFDFSLLADRLVAYQELRGHLAGLRDGAEQAEVDELFRLRRPSRAVNTRPATGHSALTLDLVLRAVESSASDVSAAELAVTVGISRATAQRYLNYLEREGLVQLRLKYRSGRPEHRYRAGRR